MPTYLVIVGLINLIVGVPADPTLISTIAYGKYILVSCAFFWMAKMLDEKRKQTDIMAEISRKLTGK